MTYFCYYHPCTTMMMMTIPTTVFKLLSLQYSICKNFTRLRWWIQAQCQVPFGCQPSDQARPTDFCCESGCIWYCPHLPLPFSPKADAHFAVPQRVEGWVNLGTAVRAYNPWPKPHVGSSEHYALDSFADFSGVYIVSLFTSYASPLILFMATL